jgi:DNA mismatch repair protein MutH
MPQRNKMFMGAIHEAGHAMLDLAHLVGLFAEVGRTKLKVAQFRPLAAVLEKPVVRKLQAAGHEFYWSPQAQLGERKHKGWELVIECDTVGRSTIFMDRKGELVLLHCEGSTAPAIIFSSKAAESRI